MTEISLDSGTIYANRYKIIRQLGVGGMGTVYLAEDQLLNSTPIALKFLNEELLANEKQVQRFLREVLLTRQVSHQNVVKTYDAAIADQQLYFVMEYVDGDSLKDLIQQKTLTTAEAAGYLQQIALGLEAIHKADIIHRDLKPGNILINSQGICKITDFGVARPDTSELTNHDEVIGSSHYMSPEAWKGELVSYKTDIYSLGIIFYQMLCGSLPFDGKTSAQIMFKHLDGKLPNIQAINPQISNWMNNLVENLLNPNPDLRPNISEIIQQLQTAGKNTPKNINQTTIQKESPLKSGYISDLDSERESKDQELWNPIASISINKNKTLANPNFGQANIKKNSAWNKLKEKFSSASNSDSPKTSIKSFLFSTILAIGICYLLIGPISNFLENYFNAKLIKSRTALFPTLLIVSRVIISSFLAALPILLVNSLISSAKDSLKKLIQLAIICGCLMIANTLAYALLLSSLQTASGLMFSAIKIVNAKGAIHLLEAAMLLPTGSQFQASIIQQVPSLKEIGFGWSSSLLFGLVNLGIYLLAIAFLLRDSFRDNYSRYQRTWIAPILIILVMSIELLVYLYLQGINATFLSREVYDWGLISPSLSTYQLICTALNWLTIMVIVKLVIPLLRVRDSA